MASINIDALGLTIHSEKGESLMTALVNSDVFIDNPCNGKGTCGKCKVRILSGNLSEPCATEKSLLTKEELEKNIRLSCMVTDYGDLTVEVIQKENQHRILTSGFVPEFQFNPAIRSTEVSVEKPCLDNQRDYENLIKEAFKTDSVHWQLLSKGQLGHGMLEGVFHHNQLVDIRSSQERGNYGVAVDIGTTTVVAALVNLDTGAELATASVINPQKQYGLDVLTRITYAMENPNDAQTKLQHAIVDGINKLIDELCTETSISKLQLYEVVIAGNTTMLHLLMGVDSTVIGKSPYAPVFVNAKTLLAKEIGIKAGHMTMLYCLPSVSAYIGADIVAGTYVCGLHDTDKTSLFIDIGTNGEIVLAHEGRLISCSCAAGPALEGMNISAGMRAQEGAIEELEITPSAITTKVIGDKTGIGLCGSGILAVVREMIKTGIVTPKGSMIKLDKLEEDDYRRRYIRLNGNKRELVLGNTQVPIVVTQSDVRQVQLAKGAILSGFYALLNKAGISMDDLDQVIVAGQFGAHLPADSLIGTGILPEGVRNKLLYVGNASKTGAYMALMSTDVRQSIEVLADRMEYMELGATEGYERLFAKCLLFDK